MVISFEGNKLEYGEYDVLSQAMTFAPNSSATEGFYKENDVIERAFYDLEGNIIVYMKSKDVFIVYDPFDFNKCRVMRSGYNEIKWTIVNNPDTWSMTEEEKELLENTLKERESLYPNLIDDLNFQRGYIEGFNKSIIMFRGMLENATKDIMKKLR